MKEITLTRINKLNTNIIQLLELLTGMANSPNVLQIISSSTLVDSIERILNYYMFLRSYIKIKIKKDKISTGLINDYLESLNFLMNDYSMNIWYIIYLKNNLTNESTNENPSPTFTYTKVFNDDLVTETANTTDFSNTSYFLILSEDFDKISVLLDETYSYVGLIIESNITTLPDYFNKYKKIDPDRLKIYNLNKNNNLVNNHPINNNPVNNHQINNHPINNNPINNNPINNNPINNNPVNNHQINNHCPHLKYNKISKQHVFNKKKCNSLNISSLIDGITTYSQNSNTNSNTKSNKLFKNNKLKKILKSSNIKKNKKINNNNIKKILLICFIVLLYIYNVIILKYDIKLELKK
jgi:hypothetical protein